MKSKKKSRRSKGWLEISKEEHSRAWAHAAIIAVNMWANEKYARFVQEPRPGELGQDWFTWFIGEWAVARTIRKDRQSEVRKYFDTRFRRTLARRATPKTVDDAVRHISRMGWSKRKGRQPSSTISLVSKVGFFFCPGHLVPYDRFARIGLNVLRRATRGGDGPGFGSYVEYHALFGQFYYGNKVMIQLQANKKWLRGYARQVGCEVRWLKKKRFKRKLFDNYLVALGQIYKAKAKSGRESRQY